MSKVPSLPYTEIIRALQRDGWLVVRQRGSHVRLQKRLPDEVLKLTVPAHLEGTWFDRTAQYRARRGGEDKNAAAFSQRELVVFTQLPCSGGLEPAVYRARIATLVDQVVEDGRREHSGRSVLGRKAILRQQPHEKPMHCDHSPAPAVHAASREIRMMLRISYWQCVAAFREASPPARRRSTRSFSARGIPAAVSLPLPQRLSARRSLHPQHPPGLTANSRQRRSLAGRGCQGSANASPRAIAVFYLIRLAGALPFWRSLLRQTRQKHALPLDSHPLRPLYSQEGGTSPSRLLRNRG